MKRRAFTLVELLVVIAIIGLLSTVAVVALEGSRMNARNIKRKTDLVQISKALELFYADHGEYPNTGGAASWGNTGNTWIPGLSEYMAKLPVDPNYNKTNPTSANVLCRTSANYNTYLYFSNGIDYKIIAHCTPEGTMSATDPFYDPVGPSWRWQVSSRPGLNTW